MHFFNSLDDKHQHNALHTQQYISLECWFQ